VKKSWRGQPTPNATRASPIIFGSVSPESVTSEGYQGPVFTRRHRERVSRTYLGCACWMHRRRRPQYLARRPCQPQTCAKVCSTTIRSRSGAWPFGLNGRSHRPGATVHRHGSTRDALAHCWCSGSERVRRHRARLGMGCGPRCRPPASTLGPDPVARGACIRDPLA
jgi:hypothetical protein